MLTTSEKEGSYDPGQCLRQVRVYVAGSSFRSEDHSLKTTPVAAPPLDKGGSPNSGRLTGGSIYVFRFMFVKSD